MSILVFGWQSLGLLCIIDEDLTVTYSRVIASSTRIKAWPPGPQSCPQSRLLSRPHVQQSFDYLSMTLSYPQCLSILVAAETARNLSVLTCPRGPQGSDAPLPACPHPVTNGYCRLLLCDSCSQDGAPRPLRLLAQQPLENKMHELVFSIERIGSKEEKVTSRHLFLFRLPTVPTTTIAVTVHFPGVSRAL